MKGNKEISFYKYGEYNVSKKRRFFLRTMPIFMIPALISLIIVSTHSKELIKVPIDYILCILLSLFIYLLFLSFFIIKRKKEKKKKKLIKKILSILGKSTVVLYVLANIGGLFLLYGPYDKFRNWLITTAMQTMHHQYLCKWFYSEDEINKVLGANYIKEVDEEVDTNLIDMEEKTTYENEYEEQILKRDKNQKYKIIRLEINGQKAYLAAVYDPSKVSVAVTSMLHRSGQYVTKMAEDHGALLGINGGGFKDPGNSSRGGTPTGITISNGKVLTNNEYGSYSGDGGLIGFTNENKLVLLKRATAEQAISIGVRDAVTWGPFLIVNGKKSFIKGNGGWGYAARTAIGQRSDGIVLLLVVDSNYNRSKGADMVDLTETMSNYGAINAANLDGGTSSVMVLPKKQALKYVPNCENEYCYINDPIDSTLAHKTRGIATSIIVTK